MRSQILIVLLLIAGLLSCKKETATDPQIEPPTDTPIDTIIHNTIIAGGGAASFQRIIGGQKLDVLYSVKQTSDDGYIFCGLTENDGASERDVLLLRTNPNGEIVWIKKYSDSYTDQGWFVEITNDNGFIIAATSSIASENSTNLNYNGQLIKTDSNGNQIWKQSYSLGPYTQFATVRQTIDGGYIVCGSEFNSHKGILIKTDASGNTSWSKTFGGYVEFNHLNKTNDGGFILCGLTATSSSSSPTDIYVIHTNSTGDTLWTKTYGDTCDNSATTIMETPLGDIILCGYNTNPGAVGFAQLLDAVGNQIWYKDFSSLNIQFAKSINTT